MTAIEDARAALAEWVEHLTDAPSQSRSDRMAAALRALIAERTAPWGSPRACFGHCDKEGWYSECVSKSTPPTDDEREALGAAIDPDGDLEGYVVEGITDRILDAGFRRQGQITDEWEYAVMKPTMNDFGDEFAVPWPVDPRTYQGTSPMKRRRKAGPWEAVEAARDA